MNKDDFIIQYTVGAAFRRQHDEVMTTLLIDDGGSIDTVVRDTLARKERIALGLTESILAGMSVTSTGATTSNLTMEDVLRSVEEIRREQPCLRCSVIRDEHGAAHDFVDGAPALYVHKDDERVLLGQLEAYRHPGVQWHDATVCGVTVRVKEHRPRGRALFVAEKNGRCAHVIAVIDLGEE